MHAPWTLLAGLLLLPTRAGAQESLPFPPAPTASVARRTLAQSTHRPSAPEPHLPPGAPNVLILMLDDVGPALPDTFGGPIHTPTLSRLADEGVAFARFHTTGTCAPTRAALLTGRNHHRVGVGQDPGLAGDWDGYTGVLPRGAAPLPKVLGAWGYDTAAFGKWDTTPADETTSMGPFDRWPTGRDVGFDHFYGFLAGASSPYAPALVEDTVRLPTPRREGYHLTQDLAGKAVAWLDRQAALHPDRPFLLYWAPGAAHGPQPVSDAWADRYAGRFDDGWDALRVRTFARQQALGWMPAGTQLTPRPVTLAAWDAIPEAERALERRRMEVEAGYVEHADAQASRLLDAIERLGKREDTLVLYVWSDNGAPADGGVHAGWAWAAGTPYQATGSVASHLGGTRTPLVVAWPGHVPHDTIPRRQFHHVVDVVPTIYDVIGLPAPRTVDGVPQLPVDGVSLAYAFASPTAPGRRPTQYFEIAGSRAIYHDGWIASALGPRIPWAPGTPEDLAAWSPDGDRWELYDLEHDPSQASDLAEREPRRLRALEALFDQEAQANGVFPIGAGLWTLLHSEETSRDRATRFSYTSDVGSVPEAAAPRIGTRSNLTTIVADLGPGDEGVLVALGGLSAGVALWVDPDGLHYEYDLLGRTRIDAPGPLPVGPTTITVESIRSAARGGPMDVTLRVDGGEVAHGTVPRTVTGTFTANDAFDVGRDESSPVSPAYADRAPYAFTGRITKVDVRYLQEPGPAVAAY